MAFPCVAQITGLIPSGDSGEHAGRIHLLTEGEASLHFCSCVLVSDSEPLFSHPLVTVMTLKERSMMDRNTKGSSSSRLGAVISTRARPYRPPSRLRLCHTKSPYISLGHVLLFRPHSHYLTAAVKLVNLRYGSPDIIQRMKDAFDTSTELRFQSTSDPRYIEFDHLTPEYG